MPEEVQIEIDDPLLSLVMQSINQLNLSNYDHIRNIIDRVNNLEGTTLFTDRVISEMENYILLDADIRSHILEMNMFINAYFAYDKDLGDRFITLVNGMLDSLNPNLYKDTVLNSTGVFLVQVHNASKNLTDTILFTWYKVIILLYLYKSQITEYIVANLTV